jgi:ATP-dependent 26S proteasome regulatory subunit
MDEKIKENAAKIKQNKVLPYLVGNVVEVSRRQTRNPSPLTADNPSWLTVISFLTLMTKARRMERLRTKPM